MKWFNNWLASKVREAWDKSDSSVQYKISAKEKYALGTAAGVQINLAGARTQELESSPDLNFRMFRAENGYVMEVRQFDRRTERHSINMHLIPDGEDLGQSIGHIITIESLKVK